jgi:hypothetical protein
MIGILVCLTSLWLCQGCVAPGQIAAGDIQDAVHIVSDRHDTYVQSDTTLTEVQSETYLRSTELLRLIVDEAVEGDR